MSQPLPAGKWKSLLVLLLLLAAGTEFAWRGPIKFLRYGYYWSDISQVYIPSRAWVEGLNPYRPDVLVALCRQATGTSPATADIRTHSPYPLTTLVVMSPLAALPWPLARILWAAVAAFAVFPMIWALAAFGRIENRISMFLFAAWTLALAPLHTGLAVGNVSIPAIGLACLAVWAAGARKDILAGILLGLATCLKPQLGIWFLFYYLVRKRWRIALVATSLGAAVLIVGILRLEISGVTWLADFLRNARGFAIDNPTVDFTEADPIRFTLINLQVLFYALGRNVAAAGLGALLAGIALLGAWLWLGFKSSWKPSELLLISSLSTLSLLPSYHRNYDATLIVFPLCWALSELDGRVDQRRYLVLFLIVPFLIPGATMLHEFQAQGRIPASLAGGWWWNTLIMPHQIWFLLSLSVFLLYMETIVAAGSVNSDCRHNPLKLPRPVLQSCSILSGEGQVPNGRSGGFIIETTNLKAWLIVCIMVAVSATFACAQPSSPTDSSTSLQTAQPPQQLKVTEYHLPPDKLAKAEALHKIRTVLYLFGLVFGILVLWVLLKLRVAPVFRDLAERVSQNGFVQILVFVPLLALTLAVVSLPIDIYQQRISLAYGLSVQNWGSWATDWCKEQGVSLAIMVVAVFGLFRIIRKSPRHWWFYFWLVSLPFVVFLIFIAPVILDPMFNKFEPLETKQPALVAQIEKVIQRGGMSIARDRMFEMEASQKVTTYNAYVTGIGATKRVVVWDNTVRDLTVPETLFVFGHEMGHYVLNHIYKGLLFAAALMFVGFWLGRGMVLVLLARCGEAWHIRGLNDLAVLPLLMLALSILTLIGEPIGNSYSRYAEHQADIYGLEITHGMFPDSAEVAASAFQKLGENSYSYPTPSPLLVFWSYDHPPISDRISFSLHYNPWDTPTGPKYVK